MRRGARMTLTGQLLAQRYRLERRIAVGGMGEVWGATDIRLDRQVAVKMLRPELSGDAEFRQRFHTEARMTASLNHPNIAAVHDYGETVVSTSSAGHSGGAEPDTAFLVMELVDGDPLAAILMRQRRLPPDTTLDILEQAAAALHAAHERGLVHRDVKPGNILVTRSGQVKLTDFGIAKAVDTAPVTRHGMVMGTAHYIAPEQAAGAEAGPAGDVYSLGVVGYECLAGQRPFRSDNVVTVAMMHIRDIPPPLPPDIPPGARVLIETTLVKDPRQRYGTGGEFAAAIAAVRAGRPLPRPGGRCVLPATMRGGPPPPQTALLPPGVLSGPLSGPLTGAPPGPPSGPYPRHHPSRPRPPRRRAAAGIALALLALLGVVLGAYAIRDALRSSGATPGAGTAEGPGPRVAPAPPGEPVAPEPGPPVTEPEPEPTTTEEAPGNVLVLWLDYVGQPGSVAAANAEQRGLQPLVVDSDGDEIDPEDRSECRVTRVSPAAGWIPEGSLLQLTCEEGL
jgi:eukaryotic-like serine/threonine-protein kinase